MVQSSSTSIAKSPIPRRRLDFELDPTLVPRDWYANDAFLTSFWNGLSLLFPEGEKFYIESVRDFRSEIHDPALTADIAGFMGQEAMHGKEHRVLNDTVRAQGYEVAARLGDEVRGIFSLVRRVFPPKARLAATCALEHFTAIMAEQLLADEAHQRAIVHAELRHFWLWHALEESEHKAVAYDVYQAVGGGYVLRVTIMMLASVVFVLEVANVHARLLAVDGRLFSLRDWARGLSYPWVRPGLLRRLILAYFDYYRPGFHPNDRDTDRLLAQFRERLFGEGGALASRAHVVYFDHTTSPAA